MNLFSLMPFAQAGSTGALWEKLTPYGLSLAALIALAKVMLVWINATRLDNQKLIDKTLNDNAALVDRNAALVETVVVHVGESTRALFALTESIKVQDRSAQKQWGELLETTKAQKAALDRICAEATAAHSGRKKARP